MQKIKDRNKKPNMLYCFKLLLLLSKITSFCPLKYLLTKPKTLQCNTTIKKTYKI